MIGMPTGSGNPVVWPQVRDAIKEHIQSITFNDRITVYTFAGELYGPEIFNIDSAAEKAATKQYIDNIEMDGTITCIYNSLMKIVGNYKEENAAFKNRIYLYSDGLDNCSDHNIQEVTETYSKYRDDYDYLYYISLGLEVPDSVKSAANRTEGFEIITTSGPIPDAIPKTIEVMVDTLTFDFTNHKKVTVDMPFKNTGNIDFVVRLYADLNINEQGIILNTPMVDVENNLGSCEIEKDYFDMKICVGEINLRLAQGEGVNLERSKFITKILLPVKRKIKIDY